MGAKQDIVIVNEFTVKKGVGGSRGKSPGRYVIQYMLRKAAAEPLSPVSYRSVYDYQTRYMLRNEATESSDYVAELKYKFGRSQGLSGLAFSQDNISLSDIEARTVAAQIQLGFDSGHTVQKMIISFTEDFLKRTGVVSDSFSFEGPRSYAGSIDQLKLRHAIQEGMNRMTEKGAFEDPLYMGCIQVDTGHVHCHLACVDMGISKQRLKGNGESRGMINEYEKRELRRGILDALQQLEVQKSFFNQVDLERRNVVSYMRNFTQKRLRDSSSLQLLLASLPPDKRLWRYNSNRQVMNRPNEIALDIVETVFKEHPEMSGYSRAMRAIREYAKEKSKETGLDRVDYINNGRDLLIERTINGMYGVLKDANYVQSISTGQLNIAKRDIEELLPRSTGEPFDPVGFELRVRGYKTRRNYHLQKSREYYQAIRSYDSQEVDPTSQPVRDFYVVELLYHRMVCDKYRHFFSFRTLDEDERREKIQEEVDVLRDRMLILSNQRRLLDNPPILSGMSDEDIDDFILNRYNIEHGSFYYNDILKNQLEEEYEVSLKVLSEDKENLKQRAFEEGFVVFLDENNEQLVDAEFGLLYSFDKTKSLDMHNLTFDFPFGAQVSETNIEVFTRMFELRQMSLQSALNYLRNTGQSEEIFSDVVNDVVEMGETVAELRLTHGLPPYEFSTSALMERQDAPRIDSVMRELDIVRESVPEITSESLDEVSTGNINY